METKQTHREAKRPQVSARYLADYMAASETARRTIIRGCKYQPIARVVQHDEARTAISHFVCAGGSDPAALATRARLLRERMTDDDFERDVLDHNADYLDRFASVVGKVALPDAERMVPGRRSAIELNGLKVTVDLHFRFRRLTKTNKVRIGGGMLRYAKGRALPDETGAWQSAFLHGYLDAARLDTSETVEPKLCVTLDAYAGTCHLAPSDAVRRFKNIEAACASIAERWSNIQPPPNAVL